MEPGSARPDTIEGLASKTSSALSEVMVGMTGGTVSTIQETPSGLPSRLPAASLLRTRKECTPSNTPDNTMGDTHERNGSPSTLHTYEASASEELNSNTAVLTGEMGSGVTLRVVCGGVTSTVHDQEAGVGSMLFTTLRARTCRVCGPSLSPTRCVAVVHEAKLALSSEHSYVAGAALELKRKSAS